MSTMTAFEKWAQPILKKYQKILLLDDHTLTFSYDSKLKNDTFMEHDFNYPYKITDIRYGDTALKYFKEKKYKRLKEILIHELCHSLTDPLYEYAYTRFTTKDALSNERERLTDHITNIIIKHESH